MPPKRITTTLTDATIKQLIAQGIANALAEYEENRSSGNGDDNHDSGSSRRRTEHITRERTLLSSWRGVVGCREWGCRSAGFSGEWGDGSCGKTGKG
nr:hypothetical protein [Tanacetum cinerariifolium]